MGGYSPIPLSSSSCSHNALGQECKRQLRPHSSEAAAERAELRGASCYQRRARTGGNMPGPLGVQEPGAGAWNSWVPLSTPTTVGNSGPLFP